MIESVERNTKTKREEDRRKTRKGKRRKEKQKQAHIKNAPEEGKILTIYEYKIKRKQKKNVTKSEERHIPISSPKREKN